MTFADIYVDTKEPPAIKQKIHSLAHEKNLKVIAIHLDFGDYIVTATGSTTYYIYERKDYSDFVGSMMSGRLHNQIEGLVEFSHPYIILEGFGRSIKSKIDQLSVSSYIDSIVNKVPIIYTRDMDTTARFIVNKASKVTNPKNKVEPKLGEVVGKDLSLRDKARKLLESFPGIGSKTSDKLLNTNWTIVSILDFIGRQVELEHEKLTTLHDIRKILTDSRMDEIRTILNYSDESMEE